MTPLRHIAILSSLLIVLAPQPLFAQEVPTSVEVTPSVLTGSYTSGDAVPSSVGVSAQIFGSGTAPVDERAPTDIAPGDPSKTFGPLLGGMMTLFASLTGYAGILLNNTVYYTVLTMGDFIHGLNSIETIWRIMRDIGNILLIFGFLAIGISTILGMSIYGWGSKMLPTLLLVAVFLNFSLFVSQAIIDVGNLFAVQVYKQINGGSLPVAQNIMWNAGGQEGISNLIMDSLGLQKLYELNSVGGRSASGEPLISDGKIMLIGFLAILLFIVAAFVMFSLAFILIARFVILLFLIVVSPIGITGLAVPKFEGYAKTWWSTIIKESATAPVLLLLLYIALMVISDDGFLNGLQANSAGYQSLANATDGSDIAGFANLLLSFFIAMGLLLFCTMAAKSMSAYGANSATKWAGRIVGGAIGLGLTEVSVFGRVFGGGVLGGAMDNKYTRAWAQKSLAGKAVATTGRFLSNRTYDIRNVKPVAAAGGALLGALSMGGKSGLESVGEGANFFKSTKTAGQVVEDVQKLKKDWWVGGEQYREQQKKYDVASAEQKRTSVLATATTAPGIKTTTDAQKELKKLSAEELAKLDGIRKGIDTLVWNLSPAAFTELMKSKHLTQPEKDSAQDTWDNQFANHASAGLALQRMSEEDRVALGGGKLSKPEVYENLNVDDFDNIKTAKLSPAEKATISTYVRGVVAGTIPVPASAPPTLRTDLVAMAAGNPKFKGYYSI